MGRQTENEQRLQSLLVQTTRKDYDDDAVQALLERDPSAVRGLTHAIFHVHVALPLALQQGASATTVRLICSASPDSTRAIYRLDRTPLHLACMHRSSLDVVSFLYNLWPEAIAIKDALSETPLHTACGRNGPSLKTIKFLVAQRPEALAEKRRLGNTPLAEACIRRPSFDGLLMFLIEEYPNGVKESADSGMHPLHFACRHGASKNVVALLADKCPEALKSKTNSLGETPLHFMLKGCGGAGTLNMPVVKLLIELWPEAVVEQNKQQLTPLESMFESRKLENPQAVEILVAIQSMLDLSDHDEKEIERIVCLFHDMKWPGGVTLILDKFPAIATKMEYVLMPRVLSLAGRRCALNALYTTFQQNPALAKGAVKRDSAEQGAEIV